MTETSPTTRPFMIVKTEDAAVTGRKKPTGYLTTILHLIKGYVGTGIFALGDSFSQAGYVLGPIALGFIALISVHCQHLLLQASDRIAQKEEVEVVPTYSEIVAYTFEDSNTPWMKKMGKCLGTMTTSFLVVAEFGFCCVYLIFISKHMDHVGIVHGFSQDYRVWLAIILGPTWLSTFITSLKVLMPLSLLANIFNWIGIIMIIYFVAKDPKLPSLIHDKSMVGHPKEYALFFGTVLFAFSAITFIIQLRAEIAKPEQFVKPMGVLNLGVSIVYILYAVVGFISYWKYDKTGGSVVLKMDKYDPVAEATKIIMSLAVMFTYTFHMYVIFEIGYPIFYRRWGPFKHPLPIMLVYKSISVILCYGFANITKDLGAFISLVGSATGGILCLVLPPVLELVSKPEVSKIEIVKDIFIIILGIFGSVVGSVFSVIEIIETFEK